MNPVTGLPVQRHRANRELEEIERTQNLISEGHEYEDALKSNEGTILVKHIKEVLMSRVDALSKADPECSALIKLLRNMGHKIAVGHKASETTIKRELRED